MATVWNSVKRLFWQSDEPLVQTVAPSGLELALRALREVPGVLGSLLALPSGAILGSDMPKLFDRDAQHQLTTRIIQLHAAMSSDGSEFSNGTVSYRDFQLHVERIPQGLLGVITRDSVHRGALTIAIHGLTRQLGASVG